MNKRKQSLWTTFMAALAVLCVSVGAVHAQDEVSTKIVGFVKAPIGEGYYFYSVPFKQIGDDEQILFLNADYDNDGTIDGFSSGTFSDQNFATGDQIYKFNTSSGSFNPPVTFKTVGTKTGWFESIPFPPFNRLTSMAFTAGEGFVVKYANPPAQGETYMLGEVNDQAVEIPISAGYNVVGNPFPTNLHIADAFAVDPDNDAISPTPGTGTTPFAEPKGDVISTGYNPDTNSWLFDAYLWDNPATPESDAQWYIPLPFPPFRRTITDDSVANPDKWILKPGQAYIYKAKEGFIWRIESPVSNN